MTCLGGSRSRLLSILTAVALVGVGIAAPATAVERFSSFGRYSGYSEATHDAWRRHSLYLPMRDGTPIALDYFLPTAGGVEAAGPLPVVLHYTRYLRAFEGGGGVITAVDGDSVLQTLLRHGYAVAVADARGTGASFGVHNGPFAAEETADSYEIIEWLAAQPWCNGHVGMNGGSYPGMTQYHAATQAPPHLDAIFAEMAGPIFYDLTFQGGTYKSELTRFWGKLTRKMDKGRFLPPAPVDEDTDGSMRDAAVAEHAGNLWISSFGRSAQYRDWSTTRRNGATWSWETVNSLLAAGKIDDSAVAVYHRAGWYDIFTTEQTMMFANLKSAPQKMMIGPWPHSGGFSSATREAEVLRWYDYWLKGIANGVMNEKPVHYYLMRGNNTVPEALGRERSIDEEQAEDGRRWQATKSWPPRRAKAKKYFFEDGPSGTVDSTNDGTLVKSKPRAEKGGDDYKVDYRSTSGSFSRWMVSYRGDRPDRPGTTFFDERTSEDERALTYTSPPMSKDLAIVGYPVVHLWVTSTHSDGDFFVYLEEVDVAGNAHYVTEGALRASCREVSDAPWQNFGLPFHSCEKESRADLPKDPVELAIDLLATAIVIDRGHRIRVTVAGADANDHALHPDRKGRKVPTVSILRNSTHRSYIELPMMKPR